MPKGNQEPTYRWCGQYARTEGTYATAMAKAYGMPPLEWQSLILDDWLAINEDGGLLNTLCVLPVPRQNGKTGCCDPRETWGLVKRGEWILHTAQEYQTAKKAFDRLRKKFGECKNDPLAQYPELNKLVDRYTTSANQMVLDLKNGAHIEFRTRGSGSDMGRGGTFDLVVIDEAQSYTEAQDAALSPLNSAAPHGSPQTILMGTVPDPAAAYKGEKFAKIRNSLHTAPYGGVCIHEWGASEIGDVSDKARWYEFNPSLGYHLLEAGLEKDLLTMAADTFAREHLGWWPKSVLSPSPIAMDDWQACEAKREEIPQPSSGIVCYAVKFAPDGSTGALAAAIRPDHGKPYVQLIAHRSMGSGVQWFADWLIPREDDAAVIVIDGRSYSGALVNELNNADFASDQIVTPGSNDVATACSMLVSSVESRSLVHGGQEQLTKSATNCRKRKIGANGGYGFESANDVDATPIEACALAFWQAMTTTRDQRREGLVG